jgi:sulfate transport system ATP-binding protein
MIERIVHLGFEVRVEFTLPDGKEAWAQVTREVAEHLELQRGQIVYVRAAQARVFDDRPTEGTDAPEVPRERQANPQ